MFDVIMFALDLYRYHLPNVPSPALRLDVGLGSRDGGMAGPRDLNLDFSIEISRLLHTSCLPQTTWKSN
jgi:hypothetical protein